MAYLLNPAVMAAAMALGMLLAVRLYIDGSVAGLIEAIVIGGLVYAIGVPTLFIGVIMLLHRRGKYRQALRFLAPFERFRLTATMARDFRGHMLLTLGEFDEAERIMRATVTDPKQDTMLRAVNLDSLGELLVQREKWDEAERVLRWAIEADPNRGGSYSSLAQVVLERDQDAEQALVILQQAMEGEGRDPNAAARTRLGNDLRCEILATQAAALAHLGRAVEAEQTLQEAIRLEPGKSRPDIADIRWRAGLVYEKLGRPSNARTHYQAAAEADPESWIGQQSRQAADRLATVS